METRVKVERKTCEYIISTLPRVLPGASVEVRLPGVIPRVTPWNAQIRVYPRWNPQYFFLQIPDYEQCYL